jgi:hypothetical protein
VPKRAMLRLMGDMLKLIWWMVIGLFRSRASLEAEIVALRHQLNALRRKSPKRLAFSNPQWWRYFDIDGHGDSGLNPKRRPSALRTLGNE